MLQAVRGTLIFPFVLGGLAVAQEPPPSGQAIYARHCADCHGDKGQGVPDECEDPLEGDRALPSLARYIDRKMPEDDPDLLNAEESQRVAEYIMGAFIRRKPGRKTSRCRKWRFPD